MIKLIVLSIKRMTKCAFCECALCEFLNSEEFKLNPQYEDNIYCLDCALKYCFDSKFYTINDMTNNSTFYVIDNMAGKCVRCEEFLNSVEFKFLNSVEFKSNLSRKYKDKIYCLDCALNYCVSNAHEAGAQYDYYRHEITFCDYDKEKITYWSDKFNFILENYKKKCMTPCIPCPMIDSSWCTSLGYSSPCYCAFKELFMIQIIYPEIEYDIDNIFIKTNTYLIDVN